jgi:hypothetical protein
LLLFALTLLLAAQAPAQPTRAADPSGPETLAVLDIEMTGDLGGPELVAQHTQRVKVESELLRQLLQQTGRYRVVALKPAQDLIQDLQSHQAYLHDCNGCDLDIGRRLGAQKVMVAWVNRVSGLILTLTCEIHDVASGQISMRKSYDFRGDNDSAWSHAIKYLVRDLSQPTG